MSTTTFPTRSDAVSTATAGKDYLIHVNKGASDLEPDWLLVGGHRQISGEEKLRSGDDARRLQLSWRAFRVVGGQLQDGRVEWPGWCGRSED